MTAAPRPRYSLREYVEIEEASIGVKHEFVSGEIYAMSGGSPEHAALTNAVVVLLGSHLRGGPCRTYSSDLRISIERAEVYTYADVAVICGDVERDPRSPSHVTNPCVLVEVLSPSTERYDREQKRLYYAQLPSLREYVLVSQDVRRVEVFRRSDEGFEHSAYGAGERARLDSVQYDLDVDELYAAAGVA